MEKLKINKSIMMVFIGILLIGISMSFNSCTRDNDDIDVNVNVTHNCCNKCDSFKKDHDVKQCKCDCHKNHDNDNGDNSDNGNDNGNGNGDNGNNGGTQTDDGSHLDDLDDGSSAYTPFYIAPCSDYTKSIVDSTFVTKKKHYYLTYRAVIPKSWFANFETTFVRVRSYDNNTNIADFNPNPFVDSGVSSALTMISIGNYYACTVTSGYAISGFQPYKHHMRVIVQELSRTKNAEGKHEIIKSQVRKFVVIRQEE